MNILQMKKRNPITCLSLVVDLGLNTHSLDFQAPGSQGSNRDFAFVGFLSFSLLISSAFLWRLPKTHCYSICSLIILTLLLGMKVLLAAKVEPAGPMFEWGR